MSGKGKKSRKGSGDGQSSEAVPFFGRRAELNGMLEQLKDPKGKAILVVGPAGIGKSSLVRRFIDVAEKDETRPCRAVTYSMTRDEQAELMLARLISEADAAVNIAAGFFSVTDRGKRQLAALFSILPKGSEIQDLFNTLKAQQIRHPRQEFVRILEALSNLLDENARAVFFIDAERTMPPDSADTWRLIVKDLPEKIILVFAQRPDDVLASSNEFLGLLNLVRIPSTDLNKLDQAETNDMLDWASRKTGLTRGVVGDTFARYDGHPYAIAAAVGLLMDGLPIADLPIDPTPEKIAETQWNQVKTKHGPDAMRLLKTHAVLEVSVRNEIVRAVSELDTDVHEALLADPYIDSILREEGDGRSVYHAILREVVTAQMDEQSKKVYHGRAAEVYRKMLAEASEANRPPDPTACIRAFEHVEVVSGRDAAIRVFVDECARGLDTLGMLQSIEAITDRWMQDNALSSASRAVLLSILGNVFLAAGKLNEAQDKYMQALDLCRAIGSFGGAADQYSGLGLVLHARGEVADALKMHRRALKIYEMISNSEGIARQCSNLGTVRMASGDLDGAAKLFNRALAMYNQLNDLEGVSIQYSNLGSILYSRGDLDAAEAMCRKALGLDEQLGRVEGMAAGYSSIGDILSVRGDLGGAATEYKKALDIYEGIGSLEGVGNQYSRLSSIALQRGDVNDSETMCRKALDIHTKIGNIAGKATAFTKLGNVLFKRMEFHGAEKAYREALALDKQIGNVEGLAAVCSNYGSMLYVCGNLSGAQELFQKALELNTRLGRQYGIGGAYINLGNVMDEQGKPVEARHFWLKAREVFSELGSIKDLEKIEGLLNTLSD